MNSQEAETLQRFSQARIHAAGKAPYLAAALFALEPKIVMQNQVSNYHTFPTDADWNIYLDPAIVIETPVSEFGWWLLHQIGHLCRHHAARLRQSVAEARWWSLAADVEVNDDLDTIDVLSPVNVVSPQSLGLPAGKLAEEYLSYIEVLDEAEGFTDCVHCDLADHNAVTSPKTLDKELLVRRIAHDIEQHRIDQGYVPVGWQRWATEKLQPTIDWRAQLRALVRRGLYHSTGRIDFSYRKPSRRQGSSQVILPTMVVTEPSIALVVDTSGSMNETQLSAVLAEINPLLHTFRRLYVICCDTHAYPVQVVRSLTDIELVGGGGTDLRVGITAALQLKHRVNLIVVLTDGNTPWPQTPPSIPVVIALHHRSPNSPSPPWGHIVEIGEQTRG